ncbi:MAG: DUF4124 domain-containing protein [Gammaproteobacteria bacterium]|nr:DUF4124 domain-containing protein [Gammaproteobacteria bacterium]
MMIRLMIIVLIVLVGAAALTTLNPAAEQSLNPIIKGLANVRSWFSGTSSVLEGIATDPLASGDNTDKNTTRVYKWQDAAGEWHFSNQPPPTGIKGSVETYRSDVNITQAPPPPVEPAAVVTEKSVSDIPTTASPLLPITDPERVKQLIEDAKNVQGLVNSRQQTIDQQLPDR